MLIAVSEAYFVSDAMVVGVMDISGTFLTLSERCFSSFSRLGLAQKVFSVVRLSRDDARKGAVEMAVVLKCRDDSRFVDPCSVPTGWTSTTENLKKEGNRETGHSCVQIVDIRNAGAGFVCLSRRYR